MEQIDLFAAVDTAPKKKRPSPKAKPGKPYWKKTHQERWEEFNRSRPEVYTEIRRLAVDDFQAGHRRLSIGYLAESARRNLTGTGTKDAEGYQFSPRHRRAETRGGAANAGAPVRDARTAVGVIPLCASCVERDATTTTEIDGRTFQVCTGCVAEVADTGQVYEPTDLSDGFVMPGPGDTSYTTRNAIVAAVRRLGLAATQDICEALGINPSSGHATSISQALHRMVKRGDLHREWQDSTRPGRGGIYSVPRHVPSVIEPIKDRVAWMALDSLDETGKVRVAPLVKASGGSRALVLSVLHQLGCRRVPGRWEWTLPGEVRMAD